MVDATMVKRHIELVKRHTKPYVWVILFITASIASYFFGFNPGISIYSSFQDAFVEMLTFIPVIFVIVGLFDVWVPKEMIERHIGDSSGIRGIALVILLAMLQVGPLYGAFPVAYILYKKGASTRNIFIFLGAFSSLKIPMLGIEIGYLGAEFTIMRTLVSLPLFILIGFLMEKLAGKNFEVREVAASTG
jgi:uncharacterized membrane protein YraQ (UPF0718 family)